MNKLFPSEQDLPPFVITTLTIKSRLVSEVPIEEEYSQENVLLPNGEWVNDKIGYYSVFSITQNEKDLSYEKMKIWSNGYDFLYRVDHFTNWHIWSNYPEHIGRKFSLTSLDNGNKCEIWHLLKFKEEREDKIFNLGGKITVLWMGTVEINNDLYIGDETQDLMIEFGHGFGTFLSETYQQYKSLYDTLISNN